MFNIKITIKDIMKLMIFILISMYVFVVSNEAFYNSFNAWVLILITVIPIYKFRNNLPVMITMIFLFYLIYSITVGEYLTFGRLGVPMLQAKNYEIYGLLLKIMIIFMSGVTLFLPNKINEIEFPEVKNNKIIFYGLYVILVSIGIFGVERTVESTYTVQISSYYEYSIILFCFAYFVSGKVKFREVLWTITIILFILQDYYYGGRITSLQLILVLLFTQFRNLLSKKNVFSIAAIGIIVNEFVGVYRRNYSFSNSVANILTGIKNNLFVFDTPVYAYYSSATHVAAIKNNLIPKEVRLESFINFFKSIFLGGQNNSGNVTIFVSKNAIPNAGGGIFPTHFYFWFGWFGVILSMLIVVSIFHLLSKKNTDYSNILMIICFVTLPRWFLYNPLILFRGLFLATIVYVVYLASNHLTKKRL